MHHIVGFDCGDQSGDTPPDSRGKPRPSFDHDAYVEWGLCGGSWPAGVGAKLSGRLSRGKSWIQYNFFTMATIR